MHGKLLCAFPSFWHKWPKSSGISLFCVCVRARVFLSIRMYVRNFCAMFDVLFFHNCLPGFVLLSVYSRVLHHVCCRFSWSYSIYPTTISLLFLPYLSIVYQTIVPIALLSAMSADEIIFEQLHLYMVAKYKASWLASSYGAVQSCLFLLFCLSRCLSICFILL